MANRLQSTDEDKTHFVRSLKGPYRAFWYWLKRACDHAGVWDIDIDDARMRTGFFDLDIDEAERVFAEKIIKLDCGKKFFIMPFCKEQYFTENLNPANTAHRGAIRILQDLRLIDLEFNVLKKQLTVETKPLCSFFKEAKDKDKDTVLLVNKEIKEVEKTTIVPKKAKEAEEIKTFLTPLVQAFRDFKEMRQRKRAPLTPRAAELIHMELKKLAGDNDELKILILQQSVRRSWSDVFPLRAENIPADTSKPAAPIATRTPRKQA